MASVLFFDTSLAPPLHLAESPKEQMKIAENIVGDILTISPTGHLNVEGAETLEARLLETTRKGTRWILLDCRHLYSMDSIGLRAVLQITRRLNALGGALALCSLPENIQEMFDIPGFTQACLIFPNLSAGLDALASEARRSPQPGIGRATNGSAAS